MSLHTQQCKALSIQTSGATDVADILIKNCGHPYMAEEVTKSAGHLLTYLMQRIEWNDEKR